MGYSGMAFTVSVCDFRRSYALTITSMRNSESSAHGSSSATSLRGQPQMSAITAFFKETLHLSNSSSCGLDTEKGTAIARGHSTGYPHIQDFQI